MPNTHALPGPSLLSPGPRVDTAVRAKQVEEKIDARCADRRVAYAVYWQWEEKNVLVWAGTICCLALLGLKELRWGDHSVGGVDQIGEVSLSGGVRGVW
jgi:hypothetical protein